MASRFDSGMEPGEQRIALPPGLESAIILPSFEPDFVNLEGDPVFFGYRRDLARICVTSI
jgi:hypothetical protein